MEPAGDDPGQGHQAQVGGGVVAKPIAGGRRTVATTTAPVTVATVPERGRPAATRDARRRRHTQHPMHRRHHRLRRVSGARGDRKTRTGRAARPSHGNGSGEPIECGANPSAAHRTQDCRVREQGTRRTAVWWQIAIGRRSHSSRDHRGEEIVI